jgi:hypothetical protein
LLSARKPKLNHGSDFATSFAKATAVRKASSFATSFAEATAVKKATADKTTDRWHGKARMKKELWKRF